MIERSFTADPYFRIHGFEALFGIDEHLASRTRQKIANKGVHQRLAEWSRGKVETNGFILLIEVGRNLRVSI